MMKNKEFNIRISVQSPEPLTHDEGPLLEVEASSPRIGIRRALDQEWGNRSPQTGRYADRQLEPGQILLIRCRRVL